MATKIIVIARTLNEIDNIGPFCTNYGFADQILITDGGSIDGTPETAQRFANVKVRDVSHLRIKVNGVVVTPESTQTNIGIEWAKHEGADWIIRDDIDCWPNKSLHFAARGIFETIDEPSVFVYRLYLWGKDKYMPKYNEPGQSLWAWQPDKIDIICDEEPFYGNLRGIPADTERHNLEIPLVCLHYFAPNEAVVQRKLERYEATGRPQVHPLHSIYAPPVPLPDWAL